nr:glycosyltransferase 87 family protein [Streptomyces coryli]
MATVPYHRDWFDLRVYYDTAHHWLQDGGRIYDYRVPGKRYGFTYPPFAALCMSPLAWLSWRSAVVAGLVVNAAAAAVVLAVLAGPAIRRHARDRRAAYGVAACLFALLEPVRDTVSFGQVNLVLLALVLADAQLLRGRHARWAGAGIGIAAAVKLTPAIFICYLLLARRPRNAALAAAVALAATLLAGWATPSSSLAYWTDALWDTDRIGRLAYVSNQSWEGVLARLAAPADPSRIGWAVGVAAILCVWARRAGRAARTGNHAAGFALTGAAACLISPVTWVHHLVWLAPALAVLATAALHRAPGRPRRRALATAWAAYALLCSSVVWLWFRDTSGADAFIGGSAYVWMTRALLLKLPLGSKHLAADQGVEHERAREQRQPDGYEAEADDGRGGRRDRGSGSDERGDESRLH